MTPKVHLYIHTPVPLFKARVNMATVTYPVSQITYDTVTLGAYTDVHFDALVTIGTTEGGDELGRTRVNKPSTATEINIARSAKGIEDGTIVVQDNAYITIWEDYRVWAKIPYFDIPNGVDYKDGDIPVGLWTSTEIPPVSNCGPGFADYIDPISELITVEFPRDGVNSSFAMADGATIASYDWDVKDGTITVGTSSSAVITATFPAGFRWVAMTVVDSNGIAHTSRCPVLAVDPANDVTYKHFRAKQRLEAKGQTIDLEIFDDLARDDYPDGTLVMLWWDGPASPDDRDHMKFIGWLDKEQNAVTRQRVGVQKGVTLSAVDVAGRLAMLPAFNQALQREDEEGIEEQWSWMPTLDINKSLHYLIHWHSTAINVADFVLPGNGDEYTAMRIDSNGGNLQDQIDQQAQKMVPDHYLTCNSAGQLVVRRDWRLDDEEDRPAAEREIEITNLNDLRWEYSRHPKVHVLRSAAILATTDWVIVEGEETLPLAFSIAPSDASAFSQGTSENTQNEGLALTQEELNIAEGHRYALLNSRFGDFSFTDPTISDFWQYEPAAFFRVQLNLNSYAASQRGVPFLEAAGMVKTIDVDYDRSEKGTRIKVSVVWNKEEAGYPAITYNPDDDETTPPVEGFIPPDLDDELVFGGDITGYVAFNRTKIFRTWNLQAEDPEWEDITGAATPGDEWYDLQYFMPDSDTCGAWLLGDSGIWLCMDIMAASPSWENVLPVATVVAADAVPETGTVELRSMAHCWATPGHLCVASSPVSNGSGYAHAYFWVTFDYGQTWEHVDHSSDLYISGSPDDIRGYAFSGRYGMAAFRSEPRIYCLRNTSRTGVADGRTALFLSEDGGLTWNMQTRWSEWSAGQMEGSVLHPYPSVSDVSYIVKGTTSGANFLNLYESVVEWDEVDDITPITPPTSHNGGFGVDAITLRVNKRTFDPDHIILLCKINASSAADLYESYDRGATWEFLRAFNNSTTTPNGWPPDPDQWVVCGFSAVGNIPIQLTLDNFTTMLDKTGDLGVANGGLITEPPGLWDGFALPKVGPNA